MTMRSEILQAALSAVSIEGNNASQEFLLAEDFSGFAGHFPGYPILPAIVQTLLGQLVAEQACGEARTLISLSRAKFVRQVHPGKKIRVEVELKTRDEGVQVRTSLYQEDEKSSEFSLLLQGKD